MRRVVLIVGAMAVLVAVSACFDDDDGGSGTRPTMANIWPHTDGSAWTYELDFAEYAAEKAGQEADLPSMESLHAFLQEPVGGTPSFAETVLYGLALDGMATTETGVEAQRVVETIEPLAGKAREAGSLTAEDAPRRLLQTIARARPDLRERVLEILGEDGLAAKAEGAYPPMFIGGYTFAYEDSGYYGYGDIDTGHAWVHLEGRLRAGEEFELQLVPALAEDIWLYGRIWSVGDRTLDGVRYDNIVECMYVIDLGLQTATDENGEPLGTFRPFIYGNTYFSPTIGPVGGREHHILGMDYILQDAIPILMTFECRFVEAVLPAGDG